MALKLGAGSESYAPLARAILGGLTVSVLLTVFLVPAAYLLVYGRQRPVAGAHGSLVELTMRKSFRIACRSSVPSGARWPRDRCI